MKLSDYIPNQEGGLVFEMFGINRDEWNYQTNWILSQIEHDVQHRAEELEESIKHGEILTIGPHICKKLIKLIEIGIPHWTVPKQLALYTWIMNVIFIHLDQMIDFIRQEHKKAQAYIDGKQMAQMSKDAFKAFPNFKFN